MSAKKHILILLTVLLSACTVPKPADSPAANQILSVEKRKTETAKISSWEITGAMAAKNQSKAWSAAMNWVQKGPNSYQIRLIGPLGGGAVVINKTGNTITFNDGKKTIASTNADKLLAQQTGIQLPVNNLYYWVRGLAAPGAIQQEQRDQYNHLIQLKQNGYAIDFTRYTAIKGIDVPGVIRLQGQGVMIKVIIKSWNT
ncbi:MAG: outer membrane lipoprotein LolB [Legionella sp.]|nr:MAG: outer membrane lipoprotein LolB [Legionella sp.]PJD99934.1 MAG: outer membrane lipoprotein LolB [Legionella sp.]